MDAHGKSWVSLWELCKPKLFLEGIFQQSISLSTLGLGICKACHPVAKLVLRPFACYVEAWMSQLHLCFAYPRWLRALYWTQIQENTRKHNHKNTNMQIQTQRHKREKTTTQKHKVTKTNTKYKYTHTHKHKDINTNTNPQKSTKTQKHKPEKTKTQTQKNTHKQAKTQTLKNRHPQKRKHTNTQKHNNKPTKHITSNTNTKSRKHKHIRLAWPKEKSSECIGGLNFRARAWSSFLAITPQVQQHLRAPTNESKRPEKTVMSTWLPMQEPECLRLSHPISSPDKSSTSCCLTLCMRCIYAGNPPTKKRNRSESSQSSQSSLLPYMVRSGKASNIHWPFTKCNAHAVNVNVADLSWHNLHIAQWSGGA